MLKKMYEKVVERVKNLKNKGNELVMVFIILAVFGIAAAATLPGFIEGAKEQANTGIEAIERIDFGE